jgi:hypothetical protein
MVVGGEGVRGIRGGMVRGMRNTCICICMCVCVCIYVYTYIHIYVYTYIHIYIHTYIHTYVCNASGNGERYEK